MSDRVNDYPVLLMFRTKGTSRAEMEYVLAEALVALDRAGLDVYGYARARSDGGETAEVVRR